PLRPDDAALVLLAATAEGLHRNGLAIEIVQLRFVVEGVDVARPTVHEEEDDALGLGGQVPVLRRKRVREGRDAVGGDGLAGEEAVGGEQAGERRGGEAGAGLPEEFAAGAATEGALVMIHGSNPSPFSHGSPTRERG